MFKSQSQRLCLFQGHYMRTQSGSFYFVWALCTIIFQNALCNAGTTSKYVRRLEPSVDLPLDSEYLKIPPGYNAPQQVHLTQGNHEGNSVIVSWVTTAEAGSSEVYYGKVQGQYDFVSNGSATTYNFYNYTSGFLHHCLIQDLKYETKYYYKLGSGEYTREFWFFTPPRVGPDSAYTFGIIGDLGQTYDSVKTLQHYLKSNGQAVLFVGDLSYADHYPFDNNERWDTWGRFIESSAAYQSWLWTAGNHELDYRPDIGENVPFRPYMHRYHTPYNASGSTSPLWYSINRASAHVIILSSYSAFVKYSPQWRWLYNDLKMVNRKRTPWLIVLMHVPWYNSNNYHYMEGEPMRLQLERWFMQFKVDIVFAGHVHAYERTYRVSNAGCRKECTPVSDKSAPVYITIGDGGNIEGLADNFTEPQPVYSAYREASFGHAILDIKNKTHAHHFWHRNEDGEAVQSDSYWLYNRYTFASSVENIPRRRKVPL